MVKDPNELVRRMQHSLDSLNNEIVACKLHKVELYEILENQKKMLLASTPSLWPAKGRLSSRFGYRISPFTGGREFHKGIDIAAKMKSRVVAPADGTVSAVRWERLAGKVLYIEHGYGLTTKYAHLHETLVKKGQNVERGDTIALVGNTGRSSGPHLHYEVHLDGLPVNPLNYVNNQGQCTELAQLN